MTQQNFEKESWPPKPIAWDNRHPKYFCLCGLVSIEMGTIIMGVFHTVGSIFCICIGSGIIGTKYLGWYDNYTHGDTSFMETLFHIVSILALVSDITLFMAIRQENTSLIWPYIVVNGLQILWVVASCIEACIIKVRNGADECLVGEIVFDSVFTVGIMAWFATVAWRLIDFYGDKQRLFVTQGDDDSLEKCIYLALATTDI